MRGNETLYNHRIQLYYSFLIALWLAIVFGFDTLRVKAFSHGFQFSNRRKKKNFPRFIVAKFRNCWPTHTVHYIFFNASFLVHIRLCKALIMESLPSIIRLFGEFCYCDVVTRLGKFRYGFFRASPVPLDLVSRIYCFYS